MYPSEAEKITSTKKMVILGKESPRQAEQRASQHDLLKCVPDIATSSWDAPVGLEEPNNRHATHANPVQQFILD